jgi:hypothetical protein
MRRTDLVSQDYEADNGRFVYVTQGKSGRKCSLLIGGRTRKVVRMTA